MKKNYDRITVLRHNKDKSDKILDLKEPNTKNENSSNETKKSIVKKNNHNYMQQTASSISKIRKSKSFKENKFNQSKSNNNNYFKKQKNIYINNYKNKHINTKNNEENNKLSSISINKNESVNHKNSSFFDNDKKKNLYHTMNNYYNIFPNPEPMPKRIIYNHNKHNNLNNKKENIQLNDIKNIKEDKNILYLLTNLNMENLYNVFISNCISFNDLFLLSKGDFSEMKIPIGPRNRILHFIYEYKKIGKNFDFQELSNFLNHYKKMIKKPLINDDMNINELFISTNNINNGSFNCFNRPIINNFVNNQNNQEIKAQKEIIEKTNLFQNDINNGKNIIKNTELEKEKNQIKKNYNLSENYYNDLNCIINNSKRKNKYNNINETKLQKNISNNSLKTNTFYNSTNKKFEFSENFKKSYSNINTNTNFFDKKNKKYNIKTLSSKNLKTKNIYNEENKQIEKTQNKKYFNKQRYNSNILLKNSNNSNYLLEKFLNINKEVNKFQKNYSKIQKKSGNINEKLSYLFLSQNSQIKENMLDFMNKNIENEKIRNLNYELNHCH